MKFSKLNWKKPALITAIAAGIVFYSCNNKSESGNNSTTTETDSTTNMSTVPSTGTDTSLSTQTKDTSTATKKRKGRITVAVVPENKQEKMQADANGYYNYSEVAPFYKGGQTAITDYITNSIEYPQDAIDNSAEGTVNVQFGIDEKGDIAYVKTIGNKIGHGLEEEAIRVINRMPNWIPGTIKGKNVKTWMIMPITFRIEE
jgi:TonB family protein